MTADPSRTAPVRYGSRYGTEAPDPVPTGRLCPICQTGTVPARARYCSDACKQRAYRLRRTADVLTDLADRAAAPRRRQALARSLRSIRASSKPTARAADSMVEPWEMRCSARSTRRTCW